MTDQFLAFLFAVYSVIMAAMCFDQISNHRHICSDLIVINFPFLFVLMCAAGKWLWRTVKG